jgi:phytoene dehydrogenase-like protein
MRSHQRLQNSSWGTCNRRVTAPGGNEYRTVCASRSVRTIPDSRRMARCWDRADWLSGTRSLSCPTDRGPHALIMRHYFNGGYYPVNGGKAFADSLVPAIEKGGGQVRTRAQVTEIMVENAAVAGVRLKDGSELRCPIVLSDAGARNTVGHLLPCELRDSAWAREILSFNPSACHIGLYLGLEGDIRARGATSSNHWFYETWDIGAGL